jgi:hypothetical protein
VTRTVQHLKLQRTDWVLLSVSPIVINRRRGLKSKAERCPLRARNTDP